MSSGAQTAFFLGGGKGSGVRGESYRPEGFSYRRTSYQRRRKSELKAKVLVYIRLHTTAGVRVLLLLAVRGSIRQLVALYTQTQRAVANIEGRRQDFQL